MSDDLPGARVSSASMLSPFGGLIHPDRRERTVRLPDGRLAKVTVEGADEVGFVKHRETDDGIDAKVFPTCQRYTVRIGAAKDPDNGLPPLPADLARKAVDLRHLGVRP